MIRNESKSTISTTDELELIQMVSNPCFEPCASGWIVRFHVSWREEQNMFL